MGPPGLRSAARDPASRGPGGAGGGARLAVPLALPAGDVAGDGPGPLEPGPRFVGRHDDARPDRVRFGWSGTGVVLRFVGTAARARMDDPAGYFAVVVDGGVGPTLVTTPGERTYALAGGLA